MNHSKQKSTAYLTMLFLVMVLGFQNCAESGPAATAQSSLAGDMAIKEAYPGVLSMEPAGGFSIEGNWVKCKGVCSMNFEESGPSFGGFTQISCDGDMEISNFRISCSNDLSLSAAQ